MHEILTLQLGHQANYLATHFWNAQVSYFNNQLELYLAGLLADRRCPFLQESYFTYDGTQAPSPVDHDIHFRPGLGAKGEGTYTPRTLIYDLKGGFGGLRKLGGLYDYQQLEGTSVDEGAKSVWNGNVVLHTDPQILQSEYQRSLDDANSTPHKLTAQTVRYWSDFNRVFYHPRSIIQIYDYELGSSLMPFDKWESGEDLFMAIDREVDLLDRDVRVWAEECDQMQGFNIYAGGDDAWGGFASRYVERLRDEFGKTAIWTWGIEETEGKGRRAKQLLRSLNAAKTMQEMSTHASMYIPLSIPATQLPPNVRLNRNSQWHVSALLSAAVESMTLPSRARVGVQKRGFLGDMEAALNVNGYQRIAQLQGSFLDPPIDQLWNAPAHGGMDDRAPSGTSHPMVEEDGLQTITTSLDINLSGGDHQYSGSSISQQRKSNHVFGAVEAIRGRNEKGQDKEMCEDDVSYAKKRRRFAGLPVIERYETFLEYPLLDSFPSILSLRANLTKVALHTSLSTTSGVSRRVKRLQRLAKQMAKYDEQENLSNGLGEISEAYEEGWRSGSDEDSDD